MKRYNTTDSEEIPKRKQKIYDSNENDVLANNTSEQSPSTKEKEYIQKLLKEKSNLDQILHSNAIRLLDQEITQVQSSGKIPPREYKYVNIYREKPIKLTTKVLVPVQEHPKFNFVGKLLGPKGNSLKRLQEETMCKMSILGKGSMRDPQKEQELKTYNDPKYAHLMDELHVEVSAFGPPAEAYARMAFALAEIRKYMIPDKNDAIRQEQLRELESLSVSDIHQDGHREHEITKLPPRVPAAPLPMMRTTTREPVLTPRLMPAKTKIMSILDKARVALEESYGNDEPKYNRGPLFGGFNESNSPTFSYDKPNYPPTDYYRKSPISFGDTPGQRWRMNPEGMTVRPDERSRYRPSTYPRSAPKGN